MSTSRDFRIQAEVLNEVLEAQDEESEEEDVGSNPEVNFGLSMSYFIEMKHSYIIVYMYILIPTISIVP